MRKFLTILLLAFSTLACASCMNGKTSSSEQQSESSITVEMSELPETATAELGERFDIPEVTATKGGKEIAVEVSVKDSNGAEVELEGRGTRFSVTDMNGYVITFSAGEGEEQMGIFLFMLETCLEYENYTYERTLFADTTDDSIEQTLVAKYTYLRHQQGTSYRFHLLYICCRLHCISLFLP